MNRVIQLKDGLEIEVEVREDESMEISTQKKVDSAIDNIQSILKKVMKPVANTYKELNKEVSMESVKVSVGIKISAEGNFIIAKSNIGAHIQVEMLLKAKND